MAVEDFLPQSFAELYAKANPDPPSDNQQLNKIEVPNDQITVSVTTQTYMGPTNLQQNSSDKVAVGVSPSSNSVDPSTLTWGGYGIYPASFANSSPSSMTPQTPNDAMNTFISAGWYWGYGGVWK